MNEWLFFLYTLKNPPHSWHEVIRSEHIKSRDEHKKTFLQYLKNAGIDASPFINGLEQMWQIWRDQNDADITCPFVLREDVKYRVNRGRTHRRSMPSIIVETLIEENAKACSKGLPYAFHRSLKHPISKGSMIEHTRSINGVLKTAEYPLAAAIIDCILHLGMRSSSARFLDSGQDDELTIHLDDDGDSGQYVKNPCGKKGVRNGAIQLMRISANTEVLSLLMLKNKTSDFHEVPWLPKDLAERLLHIKKIQDEFNPISDPIVATDSKDKFTKEATTTSVYPLFRDPANLDNHPLSSDKLTRYWNALLNHCEPIANEKRRAELGDDASDYPFFNMNGKPNWDIHSIRVTVITNLLEQGVPPTIVQNMIGHKSLLMTLHYEAVNNAKTHEAIAAAYEERRTRAINGIAQAESEDEAQKVIEQILGGLAKSDANDNHAMDALQLNFAEFKKLEDNPAGMSVFSHGICPGGNCKTGGEKFGAKHLPVHREKACSRCRYRITGPAFLQGLVLNANILMSEICESQAREKKLIAEINEHRDAGTNSAHIESSLNQERASREMIFADWAAEITTVRHAIELQKGAAEGADTSVPTVKNLDLSFVEKHNVTMLYSICKQAAMIKGASMDVPVGLRERRDTILLDIAIQNNAEKYLISNDKETRADAYHAFAELLCDVEDRPQNGADHIEQLLNGEKKLEGISYQEMFDPKNTLEAPKDDK